MGIATPTVSAFSLEFARPYATAAGTISKRDLVRVELGQAGEIGIGETVSLSLRGGEGPEAIAAALDSVAAPVLAGLASSTTGGLADPANAFGAIRETVAECRTAGLGNEALCAIDSALFDLAGRLCGEPAWRLLGADRAEPVRCNATLVADQPDSVAADALAWQKRGFGTFKLKAGTERDVEAVAAVRAALGPEARIRVDANGAWDAETAIERLRAMAVHDLELAEQPCADLLEMARVRGEVSVRIAADESVVDVDTARSVVKQGAADLATVKLAKVGGICAALDVAEQVPVYLSSALDGPTGIAAAAHAVQAIRHRGRDAGVAHGLATQHLFAAWPGGGAALDGDLLVPSGPGLGARG